MNQTHSEAQLYPPFNFKMHPIRNETRKCKCEILNTCQIPQQTLVKMKLPILYAYQTYNVKPEQAILGAISNKAYTLTTLILSSQSMHHEELLQHSCLISSFFL